MATGVEPLYSLRIKWLWAEMRRQPASFWLVCTYLMFEYVRPQQIYEAIAFLPWAQIIIISALVAFLLEGNRIRFGLPEQLLLLFTGVLLASSVAALHPEISFGALGEWASWLLIYVLIANTVTTERRFLLFMLSYLLWNLKMSQSGVRSWASDGFAFRSWGIAGAPGWFSNSGEFAIQMCVHLPVVVAFFTALRRYWSRKWQVLFIGAAIAAVVSVVGSSSRGGIVGLAAMAFWMLLKSPYKVRGLLATAALAGLVWLVLPDEQLARLKASGEDDTSISRKTFWARGIALIQERPVLGIGYENWSQWQFENFNDKMLPHNIFIEAGAEMGVTGLVAFLALIGGTLVVNARTRRIGTALGERGRLIHDSAHALDVAMIGYLATGFFVTVLFYPYFWINLAMTAALHNTARTMTRSAPTAPAPPGRRRPLAR